MESKKEEVGIKRFGETKKVRRKKNGARGMSDIEGKVTRVGVSKSGGERVSKNYKGGRR